MYSKKDAACDKLTANVRRINLQAGVAVVPRICNPIIGQKLSILHVYGNIILKKMSKLTLEFTVLRTEREGKFGNLRVQKYPLILYSQSIFT
jgi:hypothetical protein